MSGARFASQEQRSEKLAFISKRGIFSKPTEEGKETMTTACKGCQTYAGPAGCPLHGRNASNEFLCGRCGYRGPESGHRCETEPAKLISDLRERIVRLEEVVYTAKAAAAAVRADDGNGRLKDLAQAWKSYKTASGLDLVQTGARLVSLLDALETSAS